MNSKWLRLVLTGVAAAVMMLGVRFVMAQGEKQIFADSASFLVKSDHSIFVSGITGTVVSPETITVTCENGTVFLPYTVPLSETSGTLALYQMISDTFPCPKIATATAWIAEEWVGLFREYNPTAVTLAAFKATPQDGAILLTWETASELDNVGFNLYRSTAASGPYTLLNATLIPPQNPGSVLGGYYEWLDTGTQPDVTYYYKLEDVDVNGVSTFHGPVAATAAVRWRIFLPIFFWR